MDRDSIIYIISSVVLVVYIIIVHVRWKKKFDTYSEKVVREGTQLLHLEKMASIGMLSSGIAHEINNPLTFLITNLNLITRYLKEINSATDKELVDLKMKEANTSLEECIEGSDRIKKIIRDVLVFSCNSGEDKAFVNVNQLLDSTIRLSWNEIKNNADVIRDYKVKNYFWANSSQLTQVFLNIIINAVNSIKNKQERGAIFISTWEDEKVIFIKIADNGCGMPQEEIVNIFKPFYISRGGNLGLYVSKNIIDNYGGEIFVKSESGKGSEFTITLKKGANILIKK